LSTQPASASPPLPRSPGAGSRPAPSPGPAELVIGLDVGSTTVKATVVDARTRAILWSDYQRHNTRQAETVLDFLERIEAAFPAVRPGGEAAEAGTGARLFITGSGATPLAEPLGARFVQEVNAVTMAVEELHPDVGSVVELGGQDAKIIIFKGGPKEPPRGGDDGDEVQGGADRRPMASMNDKCASGTGATIDKCMLKVGMPAETLAQLDFDDTRLHHVAAKCGVFAETDVVNLVKSGIPSAEVMCSLADAIVLQNLSVLTRGNTLRHKVLLLGGPNTYLPFLRQCWQLRIPQTWDERGYDYPRDVPIEELIFAPDNAQYYAAYGAVLFGLAEPASAGAYRGTEPLRHFVEVGRKALLGATAGPPLVRDQAELDDFLARYDLPPFEPARFEPGQRVRGVIGLDGGSTSSKCVLVDETGRILLKEYVLSKGNPIRDAKEMLASLKRRVEADGATLEVTGFGATGYAADVLEESLRADVNIVETVAHMMSAVHFFGDVDVICDVGGQDIKVLFMHEREVRNFRLSNQCSAGNGMLLQAMADQFGVPVEEYAAHAFRAKLTPTFSYGCAVFLDADRVNFQKEGYSKEELLAGLALVLPKNVWQYVVQIPRMAALGRRFVLQGGTQRNLAALKAQVDYIKARVPDAEVFVHPHTGEAGAIGAAMETLRVVQRRRARGETPSTFIGLDAAIGLEYTTKNDAETTCTFCANHCSRTFIDTRTPDGRTSRYISGFSCDKGMVESVDALRSHQRARKALKKANPNLVAAEAKLAFRPFFEPAPLPEAGTPVDEVFAGASAGPPPVAATPAEAALAALEPLAAAVPARLRRLPGVRHLTGRARRLLASRQRAGAARGFERSGEEAAQRRASIRIGIPRVLNMWSTAPFWRAYLETLGVRSRNIVFSDETSEALWQAGGKYGAVDPCYPAKVAQAHVHNLLFDKHSPRTPLHYILNPSITHVPSPLDGLLDTAACPIVAGTPQVLRAAFTRETDFFAARGIEYLAPPATMNEPNLLKRQLFQAFRDVLGVTEDESDFAVDQAWAAMADFDRRMEAQGRRVLEDVERDNRLAILMLGRPYHNDPGLNHGVLEELQVLGYPILSIRSIPKDRAWLQRYFRAGAADAQFAVPGGDPTAPLDIRDVWPENYSTNSSLKVWGARFAARHPNLAVFDLSSFKCGHDAPTYAIIDNIVNAAGTPFSALHDIDANKPGGSIKIRVKTYAHSLGLHQERLEDVARREAELERRVAERRVALLSLLAEQRATQGEGLDPSLQAELRAAAARMGGYEPRTALGALAGDVGGAATDGCGGGCSCSSGSCGTERTASGPPDAPAGAAPSRPESLDPGRVALGHLSLGRRLASGGLTSTGGDQ